MPTGQGLTLHLALQRSGDPVVLGAGVDERGVASVPARTVGVFVKEEK